MGYVLVKINPLLSAMFKFWCCKFNNLFSNSYSRLRLQEGYNFVNNNAGIITMAKELIMKVRRIGKNRLAWHDLACDGM